MDKDSLINIIGSKPLHEGSRTYIDSIRNGPSVVGQHVLHDCGGAVEEQYNTNEASTHLSTQLPEFQLNIYNVTCLLIY